MLRQLPIRAFDAAVARYELSGRTLNFPGEAPLASVLAALPAAPSPPPPPPAPLPRSARTRTPKIKADAPGPLLKCERGVPIQRCNLPKRKIIEGAVQKSNGKWSCAKLFPGREFDDLDAYRAAKKQRTARRSEYSDQAHPYEYYGRRYI